MKEEATSPTSSPACWSCGEALTPRAIRSEGIIRSRSEAQGGPFWLLRCPDCGRENHCERTRRGRWFCSPNQSPSLVDYLIAQLFERGADARALMSAVTWLRDNEERRRYFFERDNDARYSRAGLLQRWWPGWVAPEAKPARSDSARQSTPDRRRASDRRHRSDRQHARGATGRAGGNHESASHARSGKATSGKASSDGKAHAPRPRSPPRRPVTPEEILGVPPGASPVEVRQAFRRLAVHYHPDKVHHLGEEFERFAQTRFLELKAAYETLVDGTGSL